MNSPAVSSLNKGLMSASSPNGGQRAHLDELRDLGEGEARVLIGGLHHLAGAREERAVADVVEQ
eukprot:2004912-Pyramimonas_sp.AAC.1